MSTLPTLIEKFSRVRYVEPGPPRLVVVSASSATDVGPSGENSLRVTRKPGALLGDRRTSVREKPQICHHMIEGKLFFFP